MFCMNCGAQVSDNAKFCPSCGGSVGNAGTKAVSMTLDKIAMIVGIISLCAAGAPASSIAAIVIACMSKEKTGGVMTKEAKIGLVCGIVSAILYTLLIILYVIFFVLGLLCA